MAPEPELREVRFCFVDIGRKESVNRFGIVLGDENEVVY